MQPSTRSLAAPLATLVLAGLLPGLGHPAAPEPTDLVVTPPGASLAATTELQPSPDPVTVDLAVFYDRGLLARGYSLQALDQVVATMIDYTNTALATSGVALTLRVTYASVFDRPLAGLDTYSAFGIIGNRSYELRDGLLTDFGADAVVVIRATDDADDYFGVAMLGTESSLSDPATVPHALVCLGAAPTSGLECFGRGGIFAHEVGHLLGAGHQRNAPVGGWGGAFEFSNASTCGGGTIVFSPASAAQPIYSTPTITAGGEPCGVPYTAGPDGDDNAHTINLTRALMAALRPTMPRFGEVFIEDPSDRAVSEGDGPLILRVRRTGNLTRRARVSAAVVSVVGTDADVTFDPTRIVFEPGQDVLDLAVSIVDDDVDEPTEAVTIDLRNPWRLTHASQSVTISIADNDEPPPPPPPPPPAPPPNSGGGGAGTIEILLLVAWAGLRRLRRRLPLLTTSSHLSSLIGGNLPAVCRTLPTGYR